MAAISLVLDFNNQKTEYDYYSEAGYQDIDEPSFVQALINYWWSPILIIYALVFFIFLSILLGFHTLLIAEFKTTQEKLKRDKDVASGIYSESPHRYGGSNAMAWCENFKKALCCRRNIYESRLSWELFITSWPQKYDKDIAAYVEG